MITNAENLNLAFKGFKTIYTDAYDKAPVTWDRIAMTVPSTVREETYGWLGQFPKMREWLGGERQVRDIEAHSFTIVNRKFESTIDIKREDFADDRLGVFKPLFAEMGHEARQHPEEMIYALIASGFTETCFDGQYFFDTDHPSVDAAGDDITVSNVRAGADPAWYLFDTSRSIKPIIWQERETYDLQTVNNPTDTRVFMTDEYLYGVRARVNAGFGLWQLAFASREPLTLANYVAARTAMMKLRGDKGRIMGIMPTTLVVPPDLEDAALRIVNTDLDGNGGSNPYKGTAELIVTPYLDV